MTDQLARAEAERRWPVGYSRIPGSLFRESYPVGDERRDAFIDGAEWARKTVLAEVRAGIEALLGDSAIYTSEQVVGVVQALAVLDRAAGETGADDER